MAQGPDVSLTAALPISKHLTAVWSFLSLPDQPMCVHSNIPACGITPRSARSQVISHYILQPCRDFTSGSLKKIDLKFCCLRAGMNRPALVSFPVSNASDWMKTAVTGRQSLTPLPKQVSGTPHGATSRQANPEPQTANKSEPCAVWKETTYVTITGVWKWFFAEQYL